MACTSVRPDLHQPLDVHRDVLAEVALDATLLLDDAADLPHVVLGEVFDANVWAHTRFLQDAIRAVPSDAVDVSEADLHSLRDRQIHACNTCHSSKPSALRPQPCLALSLFVLLVRADHPHDTLAADDLALVANPSDGRSDFHRT